MQYDERPSSRDEPAVSIGDVVLGLVVVALVTCAVLLGAHLLAIWLRCDECSITPKGLP